MEMLPTQNSGWWLAVSPRHKMRDHVWAYHPSMVYLYRLTSANGSMILETHCFGNRLTTLQSRLLLYPVSACVAAHEWRALAARLWGKRSENASTISACKIAIQLIALTNHGKGNYRKRTLENVDTPRPNGWAIFMSTIYAFGEDCGVKLSTQEHTRKTQPCLNSHKMFIEVHHNILYIISEFSKPPSQCRFNDCHFAATKNPLCRTPHTKIVLPHSPVLRRRFAAKESTPGVAWKCPV